MPIVRELRANRTDWEFLWAALPALARLRDNRKEVMEELQVLNKTVLRVADPERPLRLPERPDRKGTRRSLIKERLEMVMLLLRGRDLLLKGKSVRHVNRNLKTELTRPAPPQPPTAIREEDVKIPEKMAVVTVHAKATAVLNKYRSRLMEYRGVKTVEGRDGRILVHVTSASDEEDLGILFGVKLDGVPLVVAPVAFVSEHSETLVELDIDYARLAAESGVPAYVRVPALGTHGRFVAALAALVRGALEGAAATCSAEGGRTCPPSFGGCPLER